MPKMVHALIEEEYLVKGVLGGASLPLMWDAESGWREARCRPAESRSPDLLEAQNVTDVLRPRVDGDPTFGECPTPKVEGGHTP